MWTRTGPNLKYYKDKGISVVGVEPNEYMDSYSSDKAKAFGVDLDVRRGTGEALVRHRHTTSSIKVVYVALDLLYTLVEMLLSWHHVSGAQRTP